MRPRVPDACHRIRQYPKKMKQSLLLIIALTLLFPLRAQSPQTQPQPELNPPIDSALLDRYRRCIRDIRNPHVLSDADTLFHLAADKNDPRTQAAALSIKADHYYFTNRPDSLRAWIPRIREFARAHDQLKYYYFVWSRLIRYHINQGHYNLAQYELKQYLAQADRDDYRPAIAETYKQLGHIYRMQELYEQAADQYHTAIEYIEQNDLDRFHLHFLYSEYASTLLSLGLTDQAARAIERGKQCVVLPEQIWMLRMQEVLLCLETGRIDQAEAIYRHIEQGHGGKLQRRHLLEYRQRIETARGDHRAALATLRTLLQEVEQTGEPAASYYGIYSLLAQTHAALGHYRTAYTSLQRYLDNYREVVSEKNNLALEEFATLLDVDRLDAENLRLEREAHAERLRRTHARAITLAIGLSLATLFIIVLIWFNRRLSRAKRAAEEASRMKDIFIQNVTHEINTPLNAIIGFAELAAASAGDEAEYDSYIGIIRENSHYLRKIVTDVLSIAELESSQSLPAPTATDINACCLKCIEAVREQRPEARIRWNPGREQCRAVVCELLLSRIVTELLLNAVRFAPDAPTTLSYAVEGDRIVFTVEDGGQGIPAADAERIFERFVKLNPYTQGMGMGLTMARAAARAAGGDLRLDTACTSGCRMRFFFGFRPAGETDKA